MKKVLLILCVAVFVLASCAVRTPYSVRSRVIDFTEITRTGFFITESNSVSFDYEQIGRVTTVAQSGWEVTGRRRGADDIEPGATDTWARFGDYIYASPDVAIYELVQRARAIGANGIIDLSIEFFPEIIQGGAIRRHSSFVVSGRAIRR